MKRNLWNSTRMTQRENNMYYSAIEIFPQNIVTTDKEKIRQFNEIAEYIQGERENLDPKLKPIYEKVTKYADEKKKKDFAYRLDENGQLITQENENIRHTAVYDGIKVYESHYAEMLAKLLVEYAEYPIVIEFILDDIHWGYYINPATENYHVLAALLVQTANSHRIKIYLPTGIREYMLVKEIKYPNIKNKTQKPDKTQVMSLFSSK